MPRKRHGCYDAQKHLPDNRMQAQGTGIYVWLQEQVLQRLPLDGEQLLKEATQYGPKRYVWLCEQLKARGYQEVVDTYAQRKKVLEREQKRRFLLAQLAQEPHPDRRRWFEREIEKCDCYLEKWTGGTKFSQ